MFVSARTARPSSRPHRAMVERSAGTDAIAIGAGSQIATALYASTAGGATSAGTPNAISTPVIPPLTDPGTGSVWRPGRRSTRASPQASQAPRRTHAASPTGPLRRKPSRRRRRAGVGRASESTAKLRARRRQEPPAASQARVAGDRAGARADREARRDREQRDERRDRRELARTAACARPSASAPPDSTIAARNTAYRMLMNTSRVRVAARGARPARRSDHSASATPPAPAVGSRRVAAAPASMICALSRVRIRGVARPAMSASSATYPASEASSKAAVCRPMPG